MKIYKEYINHKVFEKFAKDYEPWKKTYEGSFVFEGYTFEWEGELKGRFFHLQKDWYGKKGSREKFFTTLQLSHKSESLQDKIFKFLEEYERIE